MFHVCTLVHVMPANKIFPSKEIEKRTLDIINNFYRVHGYFPSGTKIAEDLTEYGRSMAYNYIRVLEDKKLILRNELGHIISTNLFPPKSHATRSRKGR